MTRVQECFYRTMMTNTFLEVASVVCKRVHVAVTSLSSSLAGKVAVAVLFAGVVACWDAVFNFPSVLQR